MTGEHEEYRDEVGAYLLGRSDRARARGLRAPPRWAARECRDEVERLRPAAEALPRSVTQVAAAAEPQASLMEVVDGRRRSAAARPAAPRLDAGAPARPARRDAAPGAARPSCCCSGLLGGYGRRRSSASGDGGAQRGRGARRPRRAARGQRAGSRSRATASDGAVLRGPGHAGSPQSGRVYQVWVAARQEIVPESTFEVEHRRQRSGGGARRTCRDAKRGDGHPRAARRRARARRRSPLLTVTASSRRSAIVIRGGDLLPPPGPRDRRLLLELRAADLPRLHDADPGRHALPGVRAASGRRCDGDRRRRSRRAGAHLRPDRDQRAAFVGELAQRRERDRRQLRRQHARSTRARCAARGRGRRATGGCVTAGFLHAGFFHLLFNMFALYILGSLLEPAIGRAALRGSSTSSRCSPARSGRCCSSPTRRRWAPRAAIFGLMGAARRRAAQPRHRDSMESGLGLWIGLNLLITFTRRRTSRSAATSAA